MVDEVLVDFLVTQMIYIGQDKDGNKMMVCSNNAEARKPQVFTYSIGQGGSTQNEINLKQESKIDLEEAKVSYFGILQNEGPKIAVAYYQRKLKRITINMEDLY